MTSHHIAIEGIAIVTKPAAKILIADDVQLELELEKTFFQRSGFQVVAVKDGHTALGQALVERPQLIILDQVMPELTGTDICRALRARRELQAVPVIITSQTDTDEIREAARQAGADAFVPKSAGREALLKIAAQLLHVPQRKTLRLTVFFLAQEVVGGKETIGKGLDLSENGMALETSRRHSEGAAFQVRFMLPGDRQEVKAGAKVVSVGEQGGGAYCIGLEFTQISDMDRKRLNTYLDKALCVGA